MDLQLAKYLFAIAPWFAGLFAVAILAGALALKFRKGWIALGITSLLLLAFALIFPDVYFHNRSMPGIAAVGAWFATMVFTALFGLIIYPVVFFLVYGKIPHRLMAGSVALLAIMVSSRLYYEPVVQRYGFDLNVDIHGEIRNLEGRTERYAKLFLDSCTRYETNPVFADHEGKFRIRANCDEQLVITRIEAEYKNRPCLTRTESALSIPVGVAKFVSRAAHRKEPVAIDWNTHDADNPWSLTCIWETHPYRKDVSGSLRKLVAGELYPVRIRGSNRPYLQIVADGNQALISLQWIINQSAGATGKILLKGYQGGIQPTDDRVANRAPADGYREQVEMDLGDMQKPVLRRFYFYRGDQNMYGMLEVDFRPEVTEPLAVDLRLITGGVKLMNGTSKPRVLAAPIKSGQK